MYCFCSLSVFNLTYLTFIPFSDPSPLYQKVEYPAAFNFSFASKICVLNSSAASGKSPIVATLYNTHDNAYNPSAIIAQIGRYVTRISIDDSDMPRVVDSGGHDLMESKRLRLAFHAERKIIPIDRKS